MPELVKGWMSMAEIEWLAVEVSARKVVGQVIIAEVGCWVGITTSALAAAAAPNGVVYAVDTWNGSAEHQELLADKEADWLYAQFLNTIRDCKNVVPMRKPSVEAAAELNRQGVTFDMVFIDAAHDYENVKADINAWRSVLNPGGLLCGHDYDAGRIGVVKAVRELIAQPKLAAGSIWYEAA